MLSGTTIDNIVVGGPAYNSKLLARGDVILKVNNVPANSTNIYDLLIGDDRPGSTAVIHVSKGGLKAWFLELG
jgi:S1-C subfamily serine protease